MTRRYTREELLAALQEDTAPAGMWDWIREHQPEIHKLAVDVIDSRRFSDRPYACHVVSGMARMLYLQAQERGDCLGWWPLPKLPEVPRG